MKKQYTKNFFFEANYSIKLWKEPQKFSEIGKITIKYNGLETGKENRLIYNGFYNLDNVGEIVENAIVYSDWNNKIIKTECSIDYKNNHLSFLCIYKKKHANIIAWENCRKFEHSIKIPEVVLDKYQVLLLPYYLENITINNYRVSVLNIIDSNISDCELSFQSIEEIICGASEFQCTRINLVTLDSSSNKISLVFSNKIPTLLVKCVRGNEVIELKDYNII